jgi:hypothetical protein
MTSDVVNPGPGSGTQTEHNNTMTSDVVNPGPGSDTQSEHNNTMTSDFLSGRESMESFYRFILYVLPLEIKRKVLGYH